MIDVDKIAKLAADAQLAQHLDPNGATVYARGGNLINLDPFRTAPRRQSGTTVLHSVPSFVKLRDSFGKSGRVYVERVPFKVTAVLNDAEADKTAWRDWRLVLDIPLDRRWMAWGQHSGDYLSQEDFIDFLEQHAGDFIEPATADLIALTNSLTASSSKSIESVRSEPGDFVLNMNESTTVQSRGQKIPKKFTIGIPVFDGRGAYKLECMVKIRVSGNQAQMGYLLLRAEDTYDAETAKILAEIADGCGDYILGRP